ncbi:MAG: helix-turn-helix domain-containing protein [Candidatus Bathyarchaeia archaeon]
MKVSHDCPFCNISRKFSSMKMFAWCNREHEVIEIVTDYVEGYLSVKKEVSKLGEIVEESSGVGKVHLFTKKCFCAMENSIIMNIDSLNLLHISPVIYEGGWEYHRIIAFRHEDLKNLLDRLQGQGLDFEILRKVPFDGFIASSLTLTADALFSDLTDKQMDAVLEAYNKGYYSIPRKADVLAIANLKGIPRTTFQEHLRKAENKLISSLIPYIQLFKKAPPEKRELPKMK